MIFLPYILLNFSGIQNYIVGRITNTLSEKTGAKIEIGHFSSNFFNAIRLENIYIEDLNGDTILHADELKANFKLLPLFKKSVEIDNILLSKPKIKIEKDENNTFNFQFLIDAFKPKTAKTPEINLTLNEIELENALFSYKEETAQKTEENFFNPQDIKCQSLNTKISFSLDDSLNMSGKIKYLDFIEQSGFKLNNLALEFEKNNDSIAASTINLNTENSIISMDSVFFVLDTTTSDEGKMNIENSDCNIKIYPSKVILSDFKYFCPQLKDFSDTLDIRGDVSGKINNINTKNIRISYGKDLVLNGDIEAVGLPDISKTFFYSNINLRFTKSSLQDVIAKATQKPALLPRELNRLGACTYRGSITGFLNDLMLSGAFASNIGKIDTNVEMKIFDDFKDIQLEGEVKSKKLDIKQLLPKSEIDNISFALSTDLTVGKNKAFASNSKIVIPSITFKDYTYNDINIEGSISEEEFVGKFHLDDPNAYVDFSGAVLINDNHKAFNFITEIKNINLHALKLTDKYDDMAFAATIDANFSGNKWANMTGSCNIDSVEVERNKDKFAVEHIGITAENENANFINIDGDFVSGDIFGRYTFENLAHSFINVVGDQLPSIHQFIKTEQTELNQFSFYVNIAPTMKLLNILEIPWYTKKTATIQGQFNDEKRSFYTDISLPNISNGKININNFSFYCDNNNAINLRVKAETKLKTDSIYGELSLTGSNGAMLTSLKFDNKKDSNVIAGELITKTIFAKNKDKQKTEINILPSTFIIKDKRWDIHLSNILTDFKTLSITNFLAAGDDQKIEINGNITDSPADSVAVNLSNINLDHISDLLPEKNILHFGGSVSGHAYISNTLTKQPIIEADVKASNFMFNRSYFGTAHATSSFDIDNTCLLFKGTVKDDYQNENAILDGKYYFLKDSLDIVGNAKDLDMKFLNFYLADILDDIHGRATGNIHIHGFTKTQTVAVDAKAFIDEGQASIDFLKTTYFFSDTIEMDRTLIDLKDITVYDTEGNKALLNGSINHSYFKDLSYFINIDTKNILALNTTPLNSDMFFGKAYATGNVMIYGNEDDGATINCKLRSDANTNVTIPLDSYYAADNSFITFINTKVEEKKKKEETEESETNNNLFLDINLEATPQAEIGLLVNSKAGDIIKARGNGNIRVTYDMNSDDMKMYGTYVISEGMYLFTFQNALAKQFIVKEGSSISWTGSPTDAQIDISASHQLTASLADILDKSILSSAVRTSVPVHSILNLSGNLMQPDIKFDIQLPNAEEELRRAVENAINTEEQVNRQTISLLVLGKFINPDFMKTDNQNNYAEIYSVVSSTLSSVLNSWASQLFDNWNFGVNYRPAYEGVNANEYEFNFLYTPNNRISINGNVGYKDDIDSKNKFIGDFDFEYKLTESGKLSSKIYTHTNDYKDFKQALTTQGIGIVYRESFNNGKELVQTWKNGVKARREKRKRRKAERKEKKEAILKSNQNEGQNAQKK